MAPRKSAGAELFGSSECYQSSFNRLTNRKRPKALPRLLSRGALLFLESQLASRLAAAPRSFLARKVPDAKVSGVHEQATPVHQNLRLSRGRLDHGRPLEDRSHPDAPPIVDFRLEVGEDLVVF